MSSVFDNGGFLENPIFNWTDSDFRGQDEFTTPGAYTWVCPASVTSVDVVCVGGGASGLNISTYDGGGGGGLGWKNNIPVVPGQSYTVVVGAGGSSGNDGGNSYFIDANTVCGFGGQVRTGGSYTGDGGGNGGTGGIGDSDGFTFGAGGGGAGGYSGNGGDGSDCEVPPIDAVNGSPGIGGAGGGGGGSKHNTNSHEFGGGGGGTGIYVIGTSGEGGSAESGPGFGGSGGSNGSGSDGGFPGGGGGGGWSVLAGDGANGAVRIIWGSGRYYANNSANDTVVDDFDLFYSSGIVNLDFVYNYKTNQ